MTRSSNRQSSARRSDSSNDKSPKRDVILRGVNLSRDFECHGCGNCCYGSGYVQLVRRDEVNIAEHLGIPISEFREVYCEEEWDGSFILKDLSNSDACIFLDENNRCKIHTVKPEQCVDFPLKWRSYDFFKTCEGFLAAKKRAKELKRAT